MRLSTSPPRRRFDIISRRPSPPSCVVSTSLNRRYPVAALVIILRHRLVVVSCQFVDRPPGPRRQPTTTLFANVVRGNSASRDGDHQPPATRPGVLTQLVAARDSMPKLSHTLCPD